MHPLVHGVEGIVMFKKKTILEVVLFGKAAFTLSVKVTSWPQLKLSEHDYLVCDGSTSVCL